DYRPDGRGAAEVGFGLHPWARGRGLAVAALRAVLEHAFGSDGVHTMRWQAERGNWGSLRVAWSCGFTLDGTLRGRHTAAGCPSEDGWARSLRSDEPRRKRHRWRQPQLLVGTAVAIRP